MKKTLIALLLLAASAGLSCAKVDSDEVGVRVLNLPFVNRIEKAPKLTGYHLYIPKVHDFYILPRTYQTMNMNETGQIQLQQTGMSPELTQKSDDDETESDAMNAVDRDIRDKGVVQIAVHDRRAGNQSVRIKTADGNDAWVNVVVVYHIMPERAWLVVQKVGLDTDRIAAILGVEVRGSLRAWLGELTSPELLRAETRKLQVEGEVDPRSGKVLQEGAMQDINKRLSGFGIEIISLTAPSVTVHPDYAAVIRRKQVAEQDQYTYLSYQAHAGQEKITKVNRARGEADAEIELARGRLAATTQQADAEYEVRRLQAEADRVRFNELGAGITALAGALGGPGGGNQVALAIAEAIQGKKIFILPSQGAINTLDLNSFIANFAAGQVRQAEPFGPPNPSAPPAPPTPGQLLQMQSTGTNFLAPNPPPNAPPPAPGNGQPNNTQGKAPAASQAMAEQVQQAMQAQQAPTQSQAPRR